MVAAPSSSTEEQEHSTEPAPPEHEAHDVEPHGSEADEPSADWGWHGSFPVGGRVAGWLTAVILFGMVFFSHASPTELWWLLAIGVALVVALIANEFKRRRT